MDGRTDGRMMEGVVNVVHYLGRFLFLWGGKFQVGRSVGVLQLEKSIEKEWKKMI